MLQRILWKERLGDVVVAIVLGLVFVLTACGGGDGGQGEVEATIAERSPVGPGVVVAPAPPVLADVDSGTPRPVVTGPVSFEDAEAAFRDRRYDEAVERFTLYTEDRPTNPWGHYMLGLSAWKAGQYERAEAAFERTLELDPDHVKSLLNLSRVFLDTGRPEEALEDINRALDIDPISGDGYRLLGRARFALGDVESASEAYKRAITLDEKDVWSMNNLGYVLITGERFEEALLPLARATELRPEVAVFQNNLGIALERTGHLAAAAGAFRHALDADGGYDKAATSLARVSEQIDETTPETIDLVNVAGRFLHEIEAWRLRFDEDVTPVATRTPDPEVPDVPR